MFPFSYNSNNLKCPCRLISVVARWFSNSSELLLLVCYNCNWIYYVLMYAYMVNVCIKLLLLTYLDMLWTSLTSRTASWHATVQRFCSLQTLTKYSTYIDLLLIKRLGCWRFSTCIVLYNWSTINRRRPISSKNLRFLRAKAATAFCAF